jgi:predicted FMN-binding regulatory protein PaiB
LSGKWKVSQNQPAVNRESLVQVLHSTGNADARAVADLVTARAPV